MKSLKHKFINAILAASAYQAGADMVLHEHLRVDTLMVVSRNGRTLVFAGEVELTERHCLVNASRDLVDHKCHALLIVCVNNSVKDRVSTMISRQMPAVVLPRIRICTAAKLSSQYISEWFDSQVYLGRVPQPSENNEEKGVSSRE